MQYGIRIVVVNWAGENGGDDYKGTQQEMKTLINNWKKEGVPQNVRYTVIPYNGENGVPPAFPSQPENARKLK